MLVIRVILHIKLLFNFPLNYGRSDIVMKSKDASRAHIVIEFKQGEDVENLKYKALKQIHDNQYYAGLEGEVLCVGIAHDVKICQLVSEMIQC